MADTTIGTSVAIATPDLEIIEGNVTTTSNQIAAHFNKRHDTVLRAIRKLECSAEYRLRNFAESSYRNEQGKEQPCYRLTRDGFVFLAMGFTGKDAAQWKEAYITAFNKMEQELQARTTRPANPAIDYDRISPAQAQDLKELVHAIADSKVQGFAETWARLHRKFRVNSYLELPATRFDEARDYLLGKLPDDAAPIDPSDAPAMVAAHRVAIEYMNNFRASVREGNPGPSMGEVPTSVLQGILSEAIMRQRMLVSFNPDTGRMNFTVLGGNEFVATWPRLVKDIASGECLRTSAELLDMAAACMQRLQQRGGPTRLAA